MRRRVLITGAAGLVGRGIRPFLRPEFALRLTDRAPAGATGGEEEVQGDLADPAFVRDMVAGCDAVVHLAASHGETIAFPATLAVNYSATCNLMEAAAANGIRQVVFASSNHGWGFYPRHATPLPTEAPPRPDGWYGVSKIWGEAVMALYGDAHGMATTSLRIGNCGADVPDERRRHMWISFRDLAALTALALRRADAGHRAIFATADCARPFFDNSAAAALGFVTRDRPEDHLADPSLATAAPAPGIFGLSVGGGYAEANFRADLKEWSERK